MLIKCYLPVGFELGVSFSPLYTDGNHSIENKETCHRHSPISYENHNGECQVDMTRIFKELTVYTLPILHVHLKNFKVIMVQI